MNRRDFIKTSGVAAGMATAGMMGSTGCLRTRHQERFMERLTELDIVPHLERVDRTMNYLNRFSHDENHPNETFDRIGHSAVNSLTLSSMFRDMPLEAQLHPAMQQRMWESMDEMDQAVLGEEPIEVATNFANDPEIARIIKGPDNPGLQFLERLDRQAADSDISRRKRFRLRSIGTDVVGRMRRESPAIVYQDALSQVDKMRRTAEKCGSVIEADRRLTVRRIGQDGYDRQVQNVDEIVSYWRHNLVASNTAVPTSSGNDNLKVNVQEDKKPVSKPPATTKPTVEGCDKAVGLALKRGKQVGHYEAQLQNGKRIMKAGSWTLGISGIFTVVGLSLTAVNPFFPVIMSATIGGVLLITGLVLVAVGGAWKIRAKNMKP